MANEITIATTDKSDFNLKSMIYIVRNQQVMLDSDLAMLYQGQLLGIEIPSM